jgi:hypothetical protein
MNLYEVLLHSYDILVILFYKTSVAIFSETNERGTLIVIYFVLCA